MLCRRLALRCPTLLLALAVAGCAAPSDRPDEGAALACAPLYAVPAAGAVACREADIGAALARDVGRLSAESRLEQTDKETSAFARRRDR